MQTSDLDRTGVLDEAYERLHRTRPEFDGNLANHGPMASEALVQLGLGEHVHHWLDAYAGRLEERPRGSSRITPEELIDALGDPRRFGDWLDFFEIQVTNSNWRDVLATWWPRLLPGSLASATHSLIRVGHVVRALTVVETAPRVAELGQALGYWAARCQPMPGAARPAGFAPTQTWSGPLAKAADKPQEAARRALENGDEHVIKFTETALRADLRGLAAGRAAAAHALQIIPMET